MEGRVNTNYQRVLPRDLFNEAKLIKCMGQLSLMIHDDELPALKLRHRVTVQEPGFTIGLHIAGYLVVTNVQVTKNGKTLWLGTTYNSKRSYPLIAYIDDEEIFVFEDDGTLTEEFAAFCESELTH